MKHILHDLKLNSDGFNTRCYFTIESQQRRVTHICRKNNYSNEKAVLIKLLLSLICKEKGFALVENRNINLGDLRVEVCLLEKGKVRLKVGRNLLHFLNNFY